MISRDHYFSRRYIKGKSVGLIRWTNGLKNLSFNFFFFDEEIHTKYKKCFRYYE